MCVCVCVWVTSQELLEQKKEEIEEQKEKKKNSECIPGSEWTSK